MRFTVEIRPEGDLATPDATARVLAALERDGYHEVGYSEHPAPSRRWLDGGGHATFDPFAALAFAAALTSRLRLQTYLAVLPYRPPLMLAKSVVTLDRLSGGRFTLVAGTGYLRSEFAALGLDVADSARATDEALEVLHTVFTTDEYTHLGDGWQAHGVVNAPAPLTLPHPPVWVGGSSRNSRRRAARWGQGWAPLMATAALARTTRSVALETVDQLGAAIDDLRAMLDAAGRPADGFPVQVDARLDMVEALARPDEHHARLASLATVGATQVVVRLPHGDPSKGLDVAERYAQAFISVA